MKSLIEYINESNNIELVSDGNEHGFDYVDLGLPSGTMWATCNVGAVKPEDQGLLFQFGRVDGYKYGDENHQFRTKDQNLEDTGDEYTPLSTSGKVYKKNNILDLKDDAAHVNMGGKWIMATKDDLKELLDNTSHENETINGVKGMLFTSDINGHQIFIPFIQGWWCDGIWDNWDMSTGHIWSSQVSASYVDGAYRLYFNSRGLGAINDYFDRSCALLVRGVFKK